MIEMTRAQLLEPQFPGAYQKLMQTAGMEPRIYTSVAHLGATLEYKLSEARRQHDELIQAWAELKEENGQKFWKVPDERGTEWAEANKNFHEEKLQIDEPQLMLTEVKNAPLTPADYLVLKPIFTVQTEQHKGLKLIGEVPDGKIESENN